MIEWLVQQLQTNEIFAGLIGASTIGAVFYLVRGMPRRLYDLALRRFTVVITVHNDDDAFAWVNEWLAHHPYSRRSRRLQLSTFYQAAGSPGVPMASGDSQHWSLAPGIGTHWFMHRGRLLVVEREGAEPSSEGGGGGFGARRHESYNIRLFSRDLDRARNLVSEIRQLREQDDKLEIYRFDEYWQIMARRLLRPMDTMALPKEQKRRIVGDAERFFAGSAWYSERGVPWRRGYLFEGPPGTGKTSMALALASHFHRPLYALNLGSLRSDDSLIDALASAPAHAIVLIEDIDGTGAAHAREPKHTKRTPEKSARAKPGKAVESQPLTMSALLNTIDGAFATDGRLLIMTTNRPEMLDPALLRPGRVDLREHFGFIGRSQAHDLFRRFHPDCNPTFNVPDSITAAEVQSILLEHSDDADGAHRALVKRSLTVDVG